MPVNKAARVRHEIIDECLRTAKKRWTKQALLERVNEKLQLHYGEERCISVSQLRYDLADMQAEYGAPIEAQRDGRQVYYFYEDQEFSILNIPVTEDDIQKMKDAFFLLRQIKGFSLSDEVGELVQKLERKVQFADKDAPPVIEFEKPAIVFGLEYLEDLYYAILRKNVLKLFYQPFHLATPQEWMVHPYLLKQYNNRWYLLGLFQTNQTIGIYALDRIKRIAVCNHPYIENTQLDPQVFFQDIIGVTIPAHQTREEVVLTLAPSRAPYVLTKPIHPSQQVINLRDDGYLTVSIQLMLNPELISLLLSFGSDIQVQSPQSLRTLIKEHLDRMVHYYR